MCYNQLLLMGGKHEICHRNFWQFLQVYSKNAHDYFKCFSLFSAAKPSCGRARRAIGWSSTSLSSFLWSHFWKEGSCKWPGNQTCLAVLCGALALIPTIPYYFKLGLRYNKSDPMWTRVIFAETKPLTMGKRLSCPSCEFSREETTLSRS